MSDSIPRQFQGILWSSNIKDLDLAEDKASIINQVLAYGSLIQYRWLFSKYSKEEIIDVFIKHPIRTYRDYKFNFVKNFILGLENRELAKEKYVVT